MSTKRVFFARKRPVRVSVTVGPMFSGKTSSMISNLEKCLSMIPEEFSVLYICHKSDAEREAQLAANLGDVCSHSEITRMGINKRIVKVKCSDLTILEEPGIFPFAAVAIDEAQFFDQAVLYRRIQTLALTPFACEGRGFGPEDIFINFLDGDYLQKPFKGSALSDLISISDQVNKKTAFCLRCRADSGSIVSAPFTIRKFNFDDAIGGAEKYESVCRRHLY